MRRKAGRPSVTSDLNAQQPPLVTPNLIRGPAVLAGAEAEHMDGGAKGVSRVPTRLRRSVLTARMSRSDKSSHSDHVRTFCRISLSNQEIGFSSHPLTEVAVC